MTLEERAYRGIFLHCPEAGAVQILEDHIVFVNAKGLITHVSSASDPAALRRFAALSGAVTLPKGSFVVPTFVDGHIHAPQYLYAGTALDRPLMEWLVEYAFKAEKRIDADLELARRVYSTLAKRLIECGTGCISAFGTVGVEANLVLGEELESAGVRGYVGKVSMDRNSPDDYRDGSTDEALDAASSFVRSLRQNTKGLIAPIITPRFIPTCTPPLLIGLAKLAQECQVPIQTHASESLEELAFTKSLENGSNDIEVLKSAGLLTPRTLLAHCTHLEPGDVQTLLQHQTAVAHCPLSNLYFSTRIFEAREALDDDLKCALGSDIAGGYRLDIQEAMRSAVAVSRARDGAQRESSQAQGQASKPLAITWKDALYLATHGGARALNLAHVIGTFEPGKAFDAQLIHPGREMALSQIDLFDDPPLIELVERWFSCGGRTDRLEVWTQGQPRLDKKGLLA